MNELEKIHDNIWFYIAYTARLFRNTTTKVFQESGFDITVEMWQVLMMLWYKNGLSQQEIINCIGKEKTTITRIINNMERRNLIIRVPDRKNRRNNLIYLTHYGKELQNKLVPIAENIQEKAIYNLNENEISELKRILRKIHNNLIEI